MMRTILTTALLWCTLGILSAQEGIVPNGWVLQDRRQDADLRYLHYSIPFSFTIATTAERFDNTILQRAIRYAETLQQIEIFTIDEAKLLFDNDAIELVLIPSVYHIDGEDLLPYLPGGLRFVELEGVVRYDFRMLVDELLVRIDGIYNSELALNEIIDHAIRKPTLVSDASDADIYAEYVESRFADLIEQLSDLIEQISDLEQALQTEVSLVRRAMLALHDRNLFGKFSVPTEEEVAATIALKKADSSITIGEARRALKESAISLSRKEVLLIFAIYFNSWK